MLLKNLIKDIPKIKEIFLLLNMPSNSKKTKKNYIFFALKEQKKTVKNLLMMPLKKEHQLLFVQQNVNLKIKIFLLLKPKM